jgi:cellulose synthase/poly-beta-1,6-N-acetylglucosamine synthase-like glycosyltransferase
MNIMILESLAQFLAWIITALVLGQAALLFVYVRFLYRLRQSPLDDGECCRAAVVLCVRGLDPFLVACLKGLFQQDYPAYDVWIVVDSIRDAAWPVVNRLVKRAGNQNIHVLTLTDRLATSSRKIAGMLQAMSQIDSACEIVALLDSDTIPHSTWLRELAAPLGDPRIGVSSGNRWYMPAVPTAGSLVRYLWNAAAVVQMYWYKIGWGGSLAIQAKFLRQSDLRQRLAGAFGEDSTICRCACEHGYRIAFVPSLVMVNRETCDVRGVFGFLQRQMLTVRLHNPWWWAVVGHGIVTTATWGICGLLAAVAAATGGAGATAWLATELAAYWISMFALLVPLEWCARRIVRKRGETVAGWGARGWLRAAAAIPLAQIVHFAALAAALFARTHQWRGVRYQFYGASTVRVIEDRAEAA